MSKKYFHKELDIFSGYGIIKVEKEIDMELKDLLNFPKDELKLKQGKNFLLEELQQFVKDSLKTEESEEILLPPQYKYVVQPFYTFTVHTA